MLLLVEVADATLRTDLGRKARIYTTGGVSEYWVVDLNNRPLYVHRSTARGSYAERQVVGPGQRVSAGLLRTSTSTSQKSPADTEHCAWTLRC